MWPPPPPFFFQGYEATLLRTQVTVFSVMEIFHCQGFLFLLTAVYDFGLSKRKSKSLLTKRENIYETFGISVRHWNTIIQFAQSIWSVQCCHCCWREKRIVDRSVCKLKDRYTLKVIVTVRFVFVCSTVAIQLSVLYLTGIRVVHVALH